MNKLDLTIIIPVHNINTDLDKQLLGLSINSVFNQNEFYPENLIFISNLETKNTILDKVIIDGTNLTEMKDYKGVNLEFLINENAGNYQNQVNTTVKSVKTKYFMLLDSDDELNVIHLKHMHMHMNAFPTYDMFLTLVADTNLEKQLHRYVNEICWAKDVTGDMHGHLTTELLLNYNQISINGAAISCEKFLEIGGLKESMKLSFIYEFLLRFVQNDGAAYAISKLGYIRKVGRSGSYLDIMANTMSNDEVSFWWGLAKKEYYWPHDRNKSYVPKVEGFV